MSKNAYLCHLSPCLRHPTLINCKKTYLAFLYILGIRVWNHHLWFNYILFQDVADTSDFGGVCLLLGVDQAKAPLWQGRQDSTSHPLTPSSTHVFKVWPTENDNSHDKTQECPDVIWQQYFRGGIYEAAWWELMEKIRHEDRHIHHKRLFNHCIDILPGGVIMWGCIQRLFRITTLVSHLVSGASSVAYLGCYMHLWCLFSQEETPSTLVGDSTLVPISERMAQFTLGLSLPKRWIFWKVPNGGSKAVRNCFWKFICFGRVRLPFKG